VSYHAPSTRALHTLSVDCIRSQHTPSVSVSLVVTLGTAVAHALIDSNDSTRTKNSTRMMDACERRALQASNASLILRRRYLQQRTVQWRAFNSTTTSLSAAKHFTSQTDGVIFKIHIKSGKKIQGTLRRVTLRLIQVRYWQEDPRYVTSRYVTPDSSPLLARRSKVRALVFTPAANTTAAIDSTTALAICVLSHYLHPLTRAQTSLSFEMKMRCSCCPTAASS
jgi:hypothetical protein